MKSTSIEYVTQSTISIQRNKNNHGNNANNNEIYRKVFIYAIAVRYRQHFTENARAAYTTHRKIEIECEKQKETAHERDTMEKVCTYIYMR